MTKEMIVSSNDYETRVAILEDDEVVELFIERENQRGVVGNIYKGRVSKVLPGMQAAFVELGLERDGFLYVSDVANTLAALEQVASGEDDDEDEEEPPSQGAQVGAVTLVGEEGGESGGVAVAPAEPAEGERSAAPASRGRRRGERGDRGRTRAGDGEAGEAEQPKIEQLLHEGEDIIVQVVKEPLGTKGARLTSHVTIPGRFLVFMPTVDHVGVSRKIEDRAERSRLRGIVRQFRDEHGFTGGLIIRTAAAGRPEEDIVSDLQFFHEAWTDVRRRSEKGRAPVALYREQSLVAKLLRDLLTEEFSAIRIDNPREFRRAVDLVRRIMPNLASRVTQYTKAYPIFDEYGVQGEIDKALRSKVWLKSGGYIVINQTEALVAIDVNTGRYVGKKTSGRLEDTIVKTNLEAAKEIVRQIRLRDLGGIIVLDFIDMEEKKNRQKVFQTIDQELRRDRAPSKAVQVQDFGLIVVTRKRVKQSLERQLTDQCPYCSGTGTIKSSATICFEILTEMKKLAADLDGQGVVLRVNPDIARVLQGEEASVLRDVELAVGKRIVLKPDALLHHEQFDVMAF